MSLHFLYSDAATHSTHEVTTVWDQTGNKRKLNIVIGSSGGGTAEIWGSVEKGVAWIDHLANSRFPDGRGVSYFLIHRFALELIKYCNPEPPVGLGTPVNLESVVKASILQKNPMNGEKAAVHVYSQCGFNVATGETASTSRVRASALRDASSAKIGRWSQLFDVPLN